MKRTGGMTAIAVLDVLLGVLAILVSCQMLMSGLQGTAGAHAPAGGAAAFALVRIALGVALIVAGLGMFRMARWTRSLSIGIGVVWVVLNVLEPILLHYPMLQVVMGSIYPIVLIAVFQLPSWKRAFSSAPTVASTPPPFA